MKLTPHSIKYTEEDRADTLLIENDTGEEELLFSFLPFLSLPSSSSSSSYRIIWSQINFEKKRRKVQRINGESNVAITIFFFLILRD